MRIYCVFHDELSLEEYPKPIELTFRKFVGHSVTLGLFNLIVIYARRALLRYLCSTKATSLLRRRPFGPSSCKSLEGYERRVMPVVRK